MLKTFASVLIFVGATVFGSMLGLLVTTGDWRFAGCSLCGALVVAAGVALDHIDALERR